MSCCESSTSWCGCGCLLAELHMADIKSTVQSRFSNMRGAAAPRKIGINGRSPSRKDSSTRENSRRDTLEEETLEEGRRTAGERRAPLAGRSARQQRATAARRRARGS